MSPLTLIALRFTLAQWWTVPPLTSTIIVHWLSFSGSQPSHLVCDPLSQAPLDRVDKWMGDHLEKKSCAELHGESGWLRGHQSPSSPLQSMHVGWASWDLNLISGFYPGIWVSSRIQVDSWHDVARLARPHGYQSVTIIMIPLLDKVTCLLKNPTFMLVVAD